MQRLTYSAMLALVQSQLAKKDPHTYIVDVRDRDEIAETGMIPTALNVPLPELEDALKKEPAAFEELYGEAKPALSDRVVTHCLKGKRAEKAAEIFAQHAYTHVDIYPGSWEEWSENYKP